MRLYSLLTACTVLAASITAHADSVLVGTNPSDIGVGSGLCPSGSDCAQYAQQFTLSQSVVIDDIKVVVSAPYLFNFTNGNFNVTLGNQLSAGTEIGSGDIITTLNSPIKTEQFDFTGLDIILGPGTYNIGMTGANVLWNTAPALLTTAGTVGQTFSCDPTVTCASNRWDASNLTHAFEVDGTAVTPEPSSLILLGTGLIGFAEAARRKHLKN